MDGESGILPFLGQQEKKNSLRLMKAYRTNNFLARTGLAAPT